MSTYQPISRRPIADPFRKTAHLAVTLCCRANVHPDVISYLSIVASAAAGACFLFSARWPWLLLVAPAFCYLRLWFNMLDGMVALATGKASCRGEILNDLPDRISDVLIFVGVAHSGLCIQALGYWAAIWRCSPPMWACSARPSASSASSAASCPSPGAWSRCTSAHGPLSRSL